jgi:hypothetical protein
LEHTAIDLALTQTVRENDVPILPMVVDRILTPSADTDGGSPRTAGSSATRCAASSPVTSPGCSTGPPRCGSTRRCR